MAIHPANLHGFQVRTQFFFLFHAPTGVRGGIVQNLSQIAHQICAKCFLSCMTGRVRTFVVDLEINVRQSYTNTLERG